MQYPQRVVLGVTVLEVRHATHRNPPRLLAAAGVPGATSGGRGKPGRAEMSCADVMTASGEDPLAPSRSEEHTSELQSRPHLVCRLLLEKKKKKKINEKTE